MSPIFELKIGQKLFNYKKVFLLVVVLVLISFFWLKGSGGGTGKQPLYWVAPMDSNYRRDGPGQSPMGMDLVPVYEEVSGGGPGIVNISPEIQNQLGVRTVKVGFGSLKQSLRSYGRIIFDRTLVSKLSPRVSGWVDMLFVETEGEAVRQGQPLYSLYSPELIKAQEKYLEVLGKGSDLQILEAEDDLRVLKVDDLIIARLKDEGVVQQSVIFHAPKDGVLGLLEIGEDYYVEPGKPMLAIGSLESVWVELDVFESQAGLIKPRQFLTFTTPSYPGLIWEGEVDYIYPALEVKSQSLRFRAKIENSKMMLKPNMQVQAFITLPRRASAILVPRQSVISLGHQDRVILNLGEGRFKSVGVVLGESNSDWIEVMDGLEEDDEVVTSAHFLIDSESSKTSDFNRMIALEPAEPQYSSTWVKATLKEVNLEERTLRLQHERIEAWKMPSMTMNFKVVDGVDISNLKIDEQLRVQVADGDPLFQVTLITRLEAESNE